MVKAYPYIFRFLTEIKSETNFKICVCMCVYVSLYVSVCVYVCETESVDKYIKK